MTPKNINGVIIHVYPFHGLVQDIEFSQRDSTIRNPNLVCTIMYILDQSYSWYYFTFRFL